MNVTVFLKQEILNFLQKMIVLFLTIIKKSKMKQSKIVMTA